MANEFIHIDPGVILTKAEFELITGHQFNSQATGDILYASNSTQLSRLGIGSNTNVLEITGGVPAWVATSGTGSVARVTSPTLVTPALGTPASGVMTNVSGTASSLTAGNVTTNANLTGHVTSDGNAAVLGSFTSAQLATALTNETGSGAAVFGTSPTLVTPALGTPASGVLTNATGLPTTGIVDNAVTLGKMAGITRGSIIYGDSSGDPAALEKGTETYVLTAGASDISWAAGASGLTSTIETFTRLASAGASDQALTAAGFAPKAALIVVGDGDQGAAWGFVDDANGGRNIYHNAQSGSLTTTIFSESPGHCINVKNNTSGGNQLYATGALTSSGITFTWGVSGSGVDVTGYVLYLG